MSDELQFIHRAMTKGQASRLLEKLKNRYPNGGFETRGMNIFGNSKDPKISRDFMAGFLAGYLSQI